MAYVVPAPWGPLLSISWLSLALWACVRMDAQRNATAKLQSSRSSHRADGLRTWYLTSIGIASFAALIVVALLFSMLHWEWIASRVGGVLAPSGAVVVAAIASAGAARTLMAQSSNSRKDRLEDAERLLWDRHEKGAKQLGADSFIARTAGVYAFAGLADDWIRHHARARQIGDEREYTRSDTAECETIVDSLCALLRRNDHLDESASESKRAELAIVNEAIIASIATHMRKPDGLWADKDLRLDLRGTDLTGVLWQTVDLRNAILRDADLHDADLSGADLRGADLSGSNLAHTWLTDAIVDSETKWTGVHHDGDTMWPTEDFAIPS